MLTLLVPILLGSVALGADVAVFYYNWAQLQKAADAAALAGGTYLPQSIDRATSAAIAYAGYNGVSSSEVKSVTFGSSNTTITVTVERTVPYMFARVLGLVDNPVQASATAALVNLSGVTGALPIGLDSATPYVSGETFTMHQALSGGPGNWDGLALGCTGANCYRNNLANGYSGTISLGDTISSEPGATAGPTTQGVNTRIQNGLAFDSTATWNNYQPGDPRAAIVPIVDWSGCSGSCDVPIKAFAAVWLDSVSGTDITVTFISMVAPGSVGSSSAPDYGGQHVQLVK